MERDALSQARSAVSQARSSISQARVVFDDFNDGWDSDYSARFDNGTDYLDFGNSASIKALFNGSNPFTISVWIYPGASSGSGYVVGKFSTIEDANGRGALIYALSGTTPQFLIRRTNVPSNEISISHTAGLTTGAWNHVVATYDGSSANTGLELYIRGVRSSGTRNGTLTGSAETDGVLSFGNTYANSSRNFNAKEFAIWDRVLTYDEIVYINNQNKSWNLLDSTIPPNVRYYPVLSTDDMTSATGSVEDFVGGVNGIPRNTTSADLELLAPTPITKQRLRTGKTQFQKLTPSALSLGTEDLNASAITINKRPRNGMDGSFKADFSSSASADGFNEGVQYNIDNPILNSPYPDPANCILFFEHRLRYTTSNSNSPMAGIVYGDRFGVVLEPTSSLVVNQITGTASFDEATITTLSPLHRAYSILTIPPSYSITGYQGVLGYSGLTQAFASMTQGNNTATRGGNILTGKWTYTLNHDVAGATTAEMSTEYRYAIEKLFPDNDPTSIDTKWTDIAVADLDTGNPVGSFGSQSASLVQNGAYIDVSTTGDNTLNDGLGECINYKLIGDPVGWGDGKGKYLVVRVETTTAPSQDTNGFGIQLTAYDGDATNPSTNASIGIGVKSNTNGSGEWCPTMSNSTTNSSNVASSGATCVVYGVMPVWGDIGNKDNPSSGRQAWMTGEHVWSYNTVTDAWISPDSQSASSARLCTNSPDQLTGAFRLGVAITAPNVLTTCTFTCRISYKVMEYPQNFYGIDIL